MTPRAKKAHRKSVCTPPQSPSPTHQVSSLSQAIQKKRFIGNNFDKTRIFHSFLKDEKFCDIILISADGAKRINAHRLVLAAKIANFETKMADSIEVRTDMDTATLQRIVDFCYLNKTSVDDFAQVFELLKAAANYEIRDLEFECQEHLNASIGVPTALSFLRLSNAHNLNAMAGQCMSIICQYFDSLANDPLFNELTDKEFDIILNSDELHSPNEEFVFTAFLKWLYKAERADIDDICSKTRQMPAKESIKHMLSSIRFPLMRPQFFRTYAQKICEYQKRQDLSIEYFQYHYSLVASPREAIEMANKRMVPRKTVQKLVIFGSFMPENFFSVEVLRSKDVNGMWLDLVNLLTAKNGQRKGASAAYCGEDRIVISGGCDNICPKRQVSLIDLKTRRIVNLAAMKVARQQHSSIYADGFLYVAGGKGRTAFLNSIERYNFEDDSWTILEPMARERSQFSMVTAGGYIYVIGGRQEFRCFDSMEVYDPLKNVWMHGPRMEMLRSGAGAVVHNNAIYVAGGATMVGGHETPTAERYDFKEMTWSQIAPLNAARDLISCSVYENCVIAAGGFDDSSNPIDIVEYYDESENKWCHLPRLNRARGGALMFVTSTQF